VSALASGASREEKREAAKEMLRSFCEAEDITMWAQTRRFLHRFSLRNQLLLLMQIEHRCRPSAAEEAMGVKGELDVARFYPVQAAWRWKKAGYHPGQGEKALWIERPQRPKKGQRGWTCECRASNPPEASRCLGCGERRKPFFVPAPVFGACQVVSFADGSAPPPPPMPEPLQGDSHAPVLTRLLDSKLLGEEIPALEVVRFDSARSNPTLAAGAHGYWERQRGAIVIDGDLSPNQQLATLMHELCHAMIERGTYSYAQEEVIVETASLLAGSALGLDMRGEAPAYIANWGGRDGEPPWQAVQRHLKAIDALARRIEDACHVPAPDEEESNGHLDP
jgi:hypothetical protein